jgi:hypothetical protein
VSQSDVAYCQTCYFTPDLDKEPLEPSRVHPGEVVCESCAIYEAQWLAMTPEERREDHRMADEYGSGDR